LEADRLTDQDGSRAHVLVLLDAANWLVETPKLLGIKVSGRHLVPVISRPGPRGAGMRAQHDRGFARR